MKSLNGMFTVLLSVVVGCSVVGCSSSDDAQDAETNTASVDSRYLADSEPAGAMPVGDARVSVKDAESVTLVGRIGGSTEPFVEGLAAFTIVDLKVPHCPPEEGCPTPWDYCCTQDQVKDNIATVKIVDDAGSPVGDDARKLLGVKELTTVVVEGTAKRDDAGNLTVAATRVFVRPGE